MKMTVVLINKSTKKEERRQIDAGSKYEAQLIAKKQLGKDFTKYELVGVLT